MIIKYLTYNSLFNNGFENFEKILKIVEPDIITFQEVLTQKENLLSLEKYGYKLANFENSFYRLGKIYGVASYFKKDKFSLKKTYLLEKKSFIINHFFDLFSRVLTIGRQKTFLVVDLIEKKSKKIITFCNTHLFVIGSNNLRIKYLTKTLNEINVKKKKIFFLSGDFNYYPYQRKKLEMTMKKYQLKEATKNINQTIKISKNEDIFNYLHLTQKLTSRLFNVFLKNLKIDYIFYKGATLLKSERLEVRFSDHYPIISYFKI